MSLGLMSAETWQLDPKRLGFVLARYKFVAKMFAGFGSALEVGCADAFGTRVVRQAVPRLLAIDKDPRYVADVNARMDEQWPFYCREHDMLSGPIDGEFDGAYALDVLEHIETANERTFIDNMVRSLNAHGTLIIGMPSIYSQPYASPISRAGHVNCKTQEGLKVLLGDWFHRVFVFGMNDEVLHTGFGPMCNYLFAMGTDRK